jgi:hypothetical protein
MLIPEAGAYLDLREAGVWGLHLSHLYVLPAIYGKKDASRTPPPRPKSFLWHTNPFPENFRKNLGKWHLHSVAAPRII